MELEKTWIIENWSVEEIDFILDTYYISFWLKEDLKRFIDKCFEYDIAMTFAPPYSVAIPKHKLSLLIKKIEINEEINKQMCPEPNLHLILH